MAHDNGQADGGQHTGGGEQGERVEGSLTNGGSQAGEESFAPRTPGHTAPEGEGGGAMSGRGQEEGGDRASDPEPPKQGDQERPDADYDDRGYG